MAKRSTLQSMRERGSRIMTRLRGAYWRLFLASVGEGTQFKGPLFVQSPEMVSIGKECRFNEGVVFNARAPITIGDYVRISSNAVINAEGLEYAKPRDRRGHIKAPVVIEDGVWICTGAIINPGVTIGHDAVVGAGAVVLKDVPPRTIVVGVPARVMREITPEV